MKYVTRCEKRYLKVKKQIFQESLQIAKECDFIILEFSMGNDSTHPKLDFRPHWYGRYNFLNERSLGV